MRKSYNRNKEMISNIIVTDDGTESSDRAIEMASEIAKSSKAHLTLLHIIDNIDVPSTLILGNDRGLIERAKMSIGQAMEKGWNQRAKEKIEKLNEQNITVHSKCLTGNATERILEYADKDKASMIVMASSKRLKGISKIKALGSVTRKVSELANCPVLIVH